MGLFNFGKKDKADESSAPKAEASKKEVTATPLGERDGEKTYACQMCKKEFKQSEGNFVLEGSAFCCKEDCPPEGDGEHEVCEFC